MATKLQIVVPDPGLHELGGHHPATAISLYESFLDCNDVELRIFCHHNFELEKFNNQINITPFFNSDYYHYFYENPTYGDCQFYIRQLSKEYYDFFILLNSEQSDSQKLVLFHTMTWQHIIALTLSLEQINDTFASPVKIPQIVVFLVYGASTNFTNSKHQSRTFLNYSLAVRVLSKTGLVQIFASEYELTQFYTNVLSFDVMLHPCLLIGRINEKCKILSKNINKNAIILYLGDAKIEKGFTKLPLLLSRLMLHAKLADLELVIQFTNNNISKEISNAYDQIRTLANVNQNIRIINEFLSAKAMQNLLTKSKAIIFNYNESIYENQSSGVLWLSAYYDLKIASFSNNWVLKEAKRMGLQSKLVDYDNVDRQLTELLDSSVIQKTKYYYEFFQDFSQWLLKLAMWRDKNESK